MNDMTGTRRTGPVRSEASRLAILEAASAQFKRTGDIRLSLEAIATEAGVGKRTIYHWWDSREALIAECLTEGFLIPNALLIPDTGAIRTDLLSWLTSLDEAASDAEQLAVIRALIMHSSSDLTLRESVQERLGIDAELRDRMAVAQALGDISATSSAAVLSDAFIGVIMVRLLMGSPLHPAEIIDTLIPVATVSN